MEMIFTDQDISRQLDDEIEIMARCEGQHVGSAERFADQVAEMCVHGDVQHGESGPWDKLDRLLRFRPGELTLWAGINGHGKSNAIGMAIAKFVQQQRCLIASLEMKPKQTLYRMICQAATCRPSKEFCYRQLSEWKNNLWIYDQLDTVQSERILALVHYAAKTLSADHVVIDSLLKCGLGYENYEAEKNFVDRLQWASKAHDLHTHVVCHMRKGQDENKRLSKFDIRGAGAIADLADNIIIVQRNKAREAVMKKANQNLLLSDAEIKIQSQPGVYLEVAKNRHGGHEGVCGFYFHESSMQLTEHEGKPLRAFTQQ